ncbi:MAG TPA: hypothetical protein VH333_13905 [Pseudonocardiaceae bacterium]|jgi:hypothetical protein|nr:hypothetical protein [Pseudonocardiaceae bacterium]
MREKITLATALAAGVVAVGGTGLAASTPAVVLGLIGSAAAGANLALALTGLAECLRQHGQPEMADKLEAAARAINDELERLARLAAEQGIPVH